AITDFDGRPKPIQNPRLPILVGGGGPRLLSLAAKEADIISIFPTMLPAGGRFREDESLSSAFARKIEYIKSEAGARFAEIELNVLTQAMIVTESRSDEIGSLSREWNIAPDDLSDSPQILVGSVAEIAEHLLDVRANLGITYFVIFGQYMEAFAPVLDLLKGVP
ncbi:MAG: LLM class F420-dependent oxidoreductase, partial [Thermomicrobiales bacterium]